MTFSVPLDEVQGGVKLAPTKGWRYRIIVSSANGLVTFDDVDHLNQVTTVAEHCCFEHQRWERDHLGEGERG